jgi:hypothetical protein
MAFEDNVFVNCPFDADYKPLLLPLLFTIGYLGLRPRIALERSESGETRISKIIELIEGSKYAIHDVSRLKASRKGEISRLNMPFELGVDWGCRQFGRGRLSGKKIVILEAARFTYQAALSDIAGSDIAAHKNNPKEIVLVVRNWLANQCRPSAPGRNRIWNAFIQCMAQLHDDLRDRGFDHNDIENLPVPEFLAYIARWISLHPQNS